MFRFSVSRPHSRRFSWDNTVGFYVGLMMLVSVVTALSFFWLFLSLAGLGIIVGDDCCKVPHPVVIYR